MGLSAAMTKSGGTGVRGQANGEIGTGVFGEADGENGSGVEGASDSSRGVGGFSTTGLGVFGSCEAGFGLAGSSNNAAVYAHNNSPGMKVSWQVTGIRQDAWANAHPLPVEEEKPPAEQGHYLDPTLYGESDERHIRHVRYPEQIGRARSLVQRGNRRGSK
jgi:hypothetical protein